MGNDDGVRTVAFMSSVTRRPCGWCCATFVLANLFIVLCFSIMLGKINGPEGTFITTQGSSDVLDIRTRESYAQQFAEEYREEQIKKAEDAQGEAAGSQFYNISQLGPSCMAADGVNPRPECCPEGYRLEVPSDIDCSSQWGGQKDCDKLCKAPLTSTSDRVMFVFVADEGDNLWSPGSLSHMRKLADKILTNEEYEAFCLMGAGASGDACLPPLSPINFFYAADQCGEPLSNGLDKIDQAYMVADANAEYVDAVELAVAEGITIAKTSGLAMRKQFMFSLELLADCVITALDAVDDDDDDDASAAADAKAAFAAAVSFGDSELGKISAPCGGGNRSAAAAPPAAANATGDGGGEGAPDPSSATCRLPSLVFDAAPKLSDAVAKAHVAANMYMLYSKVTRYSFGAGILLECGAGSEEAHCDGDMLSREHVSTSLTFASTLHSMEMFNPFVSYYFDNDFSADNVVGKYSRMMIRFGLPMPGHYNANLGIDEKTGLIVDTRSEQRDAFTKWFDGNFRTWLQNEADDGPMEVLYFASSMVGDEFLKILQMDGMKAIISFLLVFLFLWYIIGSGFLAACAMFEIFASVPIAYVFYTGVLRIELFDGLNAMSIFIVTAIGADDVFVFVDAYKQSARVPAAMVDIEHRMSWTYRRAAGAMLVTSLTTCAAFVATAMSPLAGVKSFGLFCAMVIAVDYILVITFFSAAVVIYHNYIEGYKTPCSLYPKACFSSFCDCCLICCRRKGATTTTAAAVAAGGAPMPAPPKRPAEQFFGTTFANFVNKWRVAILVLFGGWFGLMCYFSSKVGYAEEPDQFLPADHPFQRIINIINMDFPANKEDRIAEVSVSWGWKPSDTTDINVLYDPTSLGKMQWDSEFDFSDVAAQAFVKSTCAEARKLSFAAQDADDPSVRVVRCFVDDFEGWLREERGLAFPVNPAEASVTDEMLAFMDSAAVGSDWIGAQNWDKWGDSVLIWPNATKINGVYLHVLTTFREQGATSHDDLAQGYEQFEAWVESVNAKAPPSCANAMQVCSGVPESKWVFLNTMEQYVTGAITGAVSGLVLAFVMLLLATLNPIIAALGTLTIFGILVSVLGIMVAAGWEMGTTESICITVLAGFAVDYCVHYAHAYMHAPFESREERVASTLDTMAISVLSGMVTSFLASVVLMQCQLQFFAKFGTFLICTVLMSYVWSNLFFTSALSLVGPRGIPTGDGREMHLQFSVGSWSKILGGGKSSHESPPSKSAEMTSVAGASVVAGV